jgi:ATP-dependent phosphoenolpyruvate carboxykinase
MTGSTSQEPASRLAAGLSPSGQIHRNLAPGALYEAAVRRQEGQIVARGPFITITDPHTGRSPVLTGTVDAVPTHIHPVFRVHVPPPVPGVPDRMLDPRSTWDGQDAYDRQAAKLASMFRENFARYADAVNRAVLAAGPAA